MITTGPETARGARHALPRGGNVQQKLHLKASTIRQREARRPRIARRDERPGTIAHAFT
jgi:hypothetical protein